MQIAPTSAQPSASASKTRSVEPWRPPSFGHFSPLAEAHDRYAGTIEKLRALCQALEAGRSSLGAELEPGALVSELRRELAQHFAAEETELHFGTIARERPDLLPQVVDLKADHAAILEALARIERRASAANRWDELPASISSLSATLRVHEQAETDLMHRLFALDHGST